MAKDPETGNNPVATDGEPSEAEMNDEIEQRRALKAARDAEQERQVTAGNGGKPIDEQPEPEQEELFEYEGGKRVSLGTMIPKGTPTEHAVVFGSARRKGAGSLIGFEDDVLLVVRGKVASVKPTVTRNDDESVKSVTIETKITPKIVVPADSDQAMDLLASVIEKRSPRAA